MSTGHPKQQDIYYANPRPDVEPSIPRGARSALDVGCSRGGFGATLRKTLGPQARLVGVEAVAAAAEEARAAGMFDEVVDGYFPDALAGRTEKFDAVFFNDVLEHIVDPWQVLLDVKDVLAPSGVVVAAIPNVQYLPVVVDLFKGQWVYTDESILDRTHVRFFTRSTMVDMFEATGYEVIDCRGANNSLSAWLAKDPKPWRRKAKTLVADRSGDRRFMHFVVTARPR